MARLKSLGAFGESWAAGYLSRLGYTITERNVRFREGEIDLIAHDNGDLVFVEVKCRRNSAFGPGEAAITPAKFRRLARAIQHYLADCDSEPASYRVDVVSLQIDASGRVVACTLLRGVESPER